MPRSRKTLRLQVRYGPGGAVVENSEIMDGAPVLKDPRPKPGTDAHWVSLEGAGRRFARRLPDPAIGREVFSEDGSITRTGGGDERVVTVDLPWWDDAAQVVFHAPGEPLEPAARRAPGRWRELNRFHPEQALTFAAPFAAAPAFPVVRLPFGTGNPKALQLVFMAEGFTAPELDLYRATVSAFLQKLAATPPFDELLSAFGALRIDSLSSQSGIDDGDRMVDTWLDGRFGEGDMRRLIEVTQDRGVAAAHGAAGASPFVGIVVVNTTDYGGSGGQVAVFSRNAAAADIALHELGHTLFGLADEYSDAVPNATPPAEPNVTLKPNAASADWGAEDLQRLKWKAQLTLGPNLPTTRNPDCANADTRPGPLGVGLFEGGKYSHCRVFRPSADCKMRTLNAAFCPVCQDVIRTKLKTFL